MRHLKTTTHPEVNPSGSSFVRRACRGIVLRERQILLLYTARYDDYSLPGGGVDEGESLLVGLRREMREEAGAQQLNNIVSFGLYREFRPWHKGGFDTVQMDSYCYQVELQGELVAPSLETYEQQNGMHPLWIDIDEAIAHNRAVMAHSEKCGLSIVRETYLLGLIAEELLAD
ncbi:MAG: NUDIX hydrolase [Pseudomonadales bacterium]